MKKKIIGAVLAALMLGGAVTVGALDTSEDVIVLNSENEYTLNLEIWKYGDINGNGAVDVDDAFQIQRYSAGKSSIFTAATNDTSTQEYRLDVADVTEDGVVDVNDAFQIQRYSAGKSSILDILLS